MKTKKLKKVSIIMGSQSDYKTMKYCSKILKILKINYESKIVSAHRTPKRMYHFATSAEKNKIQVIIAGAGGSAHLPGMVAALTSIPVIGVPIENFKSESWARYDTNLGKDNTLYTYAFVLNDKYRGRGGYGKTLKRIYINWAKKQHYTYVTGHVKQGIAQRFSSGTEIVKVFPDWYGLKTPFEYYRRPLN